MAKLDDLLGGRPATVLLKLVIVSIVVGVILAATGLQPFDVLDAVKRLFMEIYNLGWGAIELLLGWLLTGALIVVPIWILIRVFSVGAGRKP